MLALGLLLVRVDATGLVARFGAVGLVAGIAAGVGVLPYLHPIESDEALTASPVAWLGFIGPVLAVVVVVRAQGALPTDAGGAFGGMLVGLGLLNMAWGGVAAWLTADEVAAWRYSFVADWGLVLCGFGLTVADGQRGALLALFSILAGRLPLYLISRQAIRERTTTRRPINLVVAAALAGAAPFVGFGARILLLRASTQVYWPMALVLAVVMLLWLPGSLRLGRSLGQPRGRQAIGVALILAVNVAAGLYPLPLLAAARL
jgi:formate hydrogenlyase subunit 3/multisubunit Na+/H+ antiporter MnhD subunit